jgi:hypothetical protein
MNSGRPTVELRLSSFANLTDLFAGNRSIIAIRGQFNGSASQMRPTTKLVVSHRSSLASDPPCGNAIAAVESSFPYRCILLNELLHER